MNIFLIALFPLIALSSGTSVKNDHWRKNLWTNGLNLLFQSPDPYELLTSTVLELDQEDADLKTELAINEIFTKLLITKPNSPSKEPKPIISDHPVKPTEDSKSGARPVSLLPNSNSESFVHQENISPNNQSQRNSKHSTYHVGNPVKYLRGKINQMMGDDKKVESNDHKTNNKTETIIDPENENFDPSQNSEVEVPHSSHHLVNPIKYLHGKFNHMMGEDKKADSSDQKIGNKSEALIISEKEIFDPPSVVQHLVNQTVQAPIAEVINQQESIDKKRENQKTEKSLFHFNFHHENKGRSLATTNKAVRKVSVGKVEKIEKINTHETPPKMILKSNIKNPKESDITAPRIILDSDFDADDAVALLAFLGAPYHIEAISLGAGKVSLHQAITNLHYVLTAVNQFDIPVYGGEESGLLGEIKPDFRYDSDGLSNATVAHILPHSSLLTPGRAPYQLTQIAEHRKGEITLVCLGPLTNIAVAVKTDPNFFANLASIYILGGSTSKLPSPREFNWRADTAALTIVLASARRHSTPIFILPYEVADRISINMDWRLNDLGKKRSKAVETLNTVEKAMLKNKVWVPYAGTMAAILLQGKEEKVVCSTNCMSVTESGPGRAAIHLRACNATSTPQICVIQELAGSKVHQNLMKSLSNSPKIHENLK